MKVACAEESPFWSVTASNAPISAGEVWIAEQQRGPAPA